MEYQRIWLLVLFCLSSWDMHAQHFVIEGKTNGYVPDGSILYLGRWNGMGAMIYFTSDMIRNGTFRLEDSGYYLFVRNRKGYRYT